MLKNRSVSTIDGPEFINLTPQNDLISKCEIKVLYLGKNRNGSYIDKPTAEKIANSLPGVPIVAQYREEKDDFAGHGEVVTIQDGEIEFSCATRPYGFVAPDAKVWFQNFTDTDEFENSIERTYLMTTGYLWTGQFPEIQKVVNEGMPQSMELDSETLDGHWATDSESGYDFFIITDAIFSKLCVLGSDVEPCFEGASVTDLDVSKNFTVEPEFARTLFTMMEELKNALSTEGGSSMPQETVNVEGEMTDNSETFAKEDEKQVEKNAKAEEEKEETTKEEDTKKVEKNAKAEDTAEEEESTKEEDAEEDKSKNSKKEEEEDYRKQCQHALEQVESLQKEIEELKQENLSLREFKLSIENEQKDALINKYHMLSNEDKAEIITNKEKYSLEQIESQLALLYVQKNVDFTTIDGKPTEEKEVEEEPIVTFSLDDPAESISAIQQSLRKVRENK